MTKRRELLGMTVLAGAGLLGLWPRHRVAKAAESAVFPVIHTDADWRSLLSPAAYNVLRREGTETPFSSKLDFETRAGTYACPGYTRMSGYYCGGKGTPGEFDTAFGAYGYNFSGITVSREPPALGLARLRGFEHFKNVTCWKSRQAFQRSALRQLSCPRVVWR